MGRGHGPLMPAFLAGSAFENGIRQLVRGKLPSLTSLQVTIRLLAVAATGEVERDLAYRSEPSNRRSLFCVTNGIASLGGVWLIIGRSNLS